MDAAAFERLVRRIEPQARAHPAAYRLRLGGLAALAYAVIGGIVVVLAGVVGAAVYGLLSGDGGGLFWVLFLAAGALWTVVRSLWVHVEPTPGIVVERADAPELHALIDEACAAVDAPPVRRVVLVADANAAVARLWRVGGLVDAGSELVLGAPLLLGLSAEQARAVVVHEAAHLSRHVRVGARLYRLRARWAQVLTALEQRRRGWTRAFVQRFLTWYVPYLDAYAWPLLRAHELEADSAAAAAAGARVTGSMLVSIALLQRWLLDEYFAGVWRRMPDEPTPPRDVATQLQRAVVDSKRYGDVDAWYAEQLDVEPALDDSHPTLRARLEHLGVDPGDALEEARRPPAQSAAEAYLGPAQERLLAEVDALWASSAAEAWGAGHAVESEGTQELRRLDGLADAGALAENGALQRARLVEAYRSDDEALALYRELLGGEQDTAARFDVGRILLERGDDEGLRYLDEAADADVEAVLPACELAYAYLAERGRPEEAERYRLRHDQHIELLEEAALERSSVSADDRLELPALPREAVERVRAAVAGVEGVAFAFFVRKRTEHLDETHPFHVVVIAPRGRRHARTLLERTAAAVEDTEADFVWLVRASQPLVVVLDELAGAELDLG